MSSYSWIFPEGEGEHYVSLSIPSPTLSDILENFKENILEDNNNSSNDTKQYLKKHKTDKNNHEGNRTTHGEVSLSDDDNNNEAFENTMKTIKQTTVVTLKMRMTLDQVTKMGQPLYSREFHS